jgi:hypothetical protein
MDEVEQKSTMLNRQLEDLQVFAVAVAVRPCLVLLTQLRMLFWLRSLVAISCGRSWSTRSTTSRI